MRTHGGKYGGNNGKQAWLLIKGNDRYARSAGVGIVDSAPKSVTTGRSLDQIAAARSNVWESRLSASENVRAGAIAETKPLAPKRRATPDAPSEASAHATPDGARAAPLPAALTPMLTTLVAATPRGNEWLHEIKYDGYRMLCRIDRGKVRLYSRNAKDWTSVFAAIAADLAKLPVRTAWIDGEIVVMDAAGRSSFQALQNALSARVSAFLFFAFDLVYRDGYDLRRVAALVERKRLLREVVGNRRGRNTRRPRRCKATATNFSNRPVR